MDNVMLTIKNLHARVEDKEILRGINLTVKAGNVVTANNMDLMTINQVEPIYVTFSIPEAQLAAVKKYKEMGNLSVRARPQDADDSHEETGNLTFIEVFRRILEYDGPGLNPGPFAILNFDYA